MTWNVDREIFSIGFFALRWYSLFFASGFVLGYFMVREIFRAEGKSEALLDSLLFHLVVGTVVGARLGHCLFYEPYTYLHDPLRILQIWEGGLASHGGFAGVIVALILFCRKHQSISFFWLIDRVAIPTMIEAACIRIGNFFNSEIIGHPTDGPWGVVFTKVDNIARHPTQLYEAAGYFLCFVMLFVMYRTAGRKPMEGRLFGANLVVAWTFRIFVERYKENQVAFENDMTWNMGQLLSVPFILFGLFLLFGLHYKVPFFRRGLSDEALAKAGVPREEEGGPGGGSGEASGPGSRKGQLRKMNKKART